MDLFFLRHGEAGDSATWAGPDGERPLTAAGRLELEALVEVLIPQRMRLDNLVSSPLARAYQTAEIVAQRTGLGVEVDDLLRPGFDLNRLRQVLRRYPAARRVMLVGHEPDFSATISALIGGGSLTLKKAGLARVRLPDVRDARGSLLWLTSPGLLLGDN